MKRNYELVYTRGLEFLADIFPDLAIEDDNSFQEDFSINDEINSDGCKISFVSDNSLKPNYYSLL